MNYNQNFAENYNVLLYIIFYMPTAVWLMAHIFLARKKPLSIIFKNAHLQVVVHVSFCSVIFIK